MALTIIVGLLILVLAAVPVAAVLGILSFVLDHISMGGSLTPALAEIYWDKSKEFVLVAVPMFILLGEIMLRAVVLFGDTSGILGFSLIGIPLKTLIKSFYMIGHP